MDGNFVDKIVHEVKSQGVFDEFRKDSLADVDTKPAYQNLRGRVESAVKSFLSDQKWTPETNKIQLREKLRKHIADLGFLDIGVERIVDQVVGPKIRTIYQPKIELIAYKFLGITPPEPPIGAPPPVPQILEPPPLPSLGHLNGTMLTVETTSSLLPTDLEQISPDSDRATVKSDIKDDSKDDDDLPPGVDADEAPFDDDISPPFEPIIKLESPRPQVKEESLPGFVVKKVEKKEDDLLKNEEHVGADNGKGDVVESIRITESIKVEVNASLDAGASQESQLSQISSDSRLTVASAISTADREQSKEDFLTPTSAANMSEEAQMPNFNDNSCEAGTENSGSDLHFDIKKDTIKFEGTERRNSLSDVVEKSNGDNQIAIEDAIMSEVQKNLTDQNDTVTEDQKQNTPSTPPAQEPSFGSCGDDTQNSVIQKTPKDDDIEKNVCDSKQTVSNVESAQQKPDCESELPENSKDELIKPSTPSSSTSSSRNKRHSKEKPHSSDGKHRRRSISAHRDSSRDKSHSRSKHSSVSKHSSSSSSKHSLHKSSHRDKSASTQSSSASSSRSSTAHDSSSKRSDRRDSDRKYKSSSSKSDRKEHSRSSSTSKKSDRNRHKSSSTHDDHNESRIKSQRRRSNDSNDEGKKANGKPTSTPSQTLNTTSSSPKSKGQSGTEETNGNGTNGYKDANDHNANVSKVVFLNEILEHPSTDYIELTSSGGKVIKSGVENSVSAVIIDEPTASKSTTIENMNDSQDEIASNASSDSDLLYFEENNSEFEPRLRLLESIIDGFREVVNNLRISKDACNEKDENQKERQTAAPKRIRLSKIEHITCESSTYGSHVADKINIVTASDTDEHEPENKRIKRNESKTSPAPSDASSANSKENEALEKDETDADGSQLRAKLAGTSFSKLCQQQRYTNDDLYKPRPVLSQRSRRRHLDSIP